MNLEDDDDDSNVKTSGRNQLLPDNEVSCISSFQPVLKVEPSSNVVSQSGRKDQNYFGFSRTDSCAEEQADNIPKYISESRNSTNELSLNVGCDSCVSRSESKQSLIPSNETNEQDCEKENIRNHQSESYVPLEPDCVHISCNAECKSVNDPSCSTFIKSIPGDIPLGDSEKDKARNGAGLDDASYSSNEQLPNLRRHIGIRSLIAFWLLGLCNNYGYVVMLSAAHDILGHKYHETVTGNNDSTLATLTTTTVAPTVNPNPRDCNTMTTGAILLADIIPSLTIKVTAPFFPLYIHFRLALVVLLSIAGYVLVAASVAPWMAICGVISTALASGIGEASLLSYMAFYKDKDVISMWSSGTGGAGFFGSLSYAFLLSIGLTPAATLYGLSSIPVLMGITFWVILKHPKLNERPSTPPVDSDNVESDTNQPTSLDRCYSEEVPLETTKDSLFEKLTYIPNLFKFMIPIGLVYLFEYFINQGLMELVYFRGIWLTHAEQYRWYQVLYQIGVFISRSSLRLIQINHLWLLGVLQFVNVIFFLVESVYSVIPTIYVVMAIVLWEGLLGGAAYVNTFHKITVEVPPGKREFSMAITSLADALGITIAGISAFPTHNYICNLPLY